MREHEHCIGCLVCRLISYLFHAHKQKWIFKELTKKGEFNGRVVHKLVVELIDKLNTCLEENGELACVYMFNSMDGYLEVRDCNEPVYASLRCII